MAMAHHSLEWEILHQVVVFPCNRSLQKRLCQFSDFECQILSQPVILKLPSTQVPIRGQGFHDLQGACGLLDSGNLTLQDTLSTTTLKTMVDRCLKEYVQESKPPTNNTIGHYCVSGADSFDFLGVGSNKMSQIFGTDHSWFGDIWIKSTSLLLVDTFYKHDLLHVNTAGFASRCSRRRRGVRSAWRRPGLT